MTSKEIFRNIVDGLEDLLQSLYNSLLSKERKEQCKQIEKDLEKLENFEKALDIDLSVLQELRKREWIVKNNGETVQVIGIDFNTDDSLILYNEDNQEMFTSDLCLKDYGKTWALTKEELEDEK